MINLSGVIHSPRLSQPIVIERQSGEWIDGEFVGSKSVRLYMRAIVTVATARDLAQVPEGDRQGGAMRVLTTEPLRLVGQYGSNYGDVLLWRGERYRVLSVSPDADYGFYRSICTRQG